MVKEKRFDWNPGSLHKHNHICIKISVSLVLMGFAFRLFFSQSFGVFPVSDRPKAEKHDVGEPPLPDLSLEVENPVSDRPLPEKSDVAEPAPPDFSLEVQHQDSPERCDLFKGTWIPNPSGPIYDNESCAVVEPHQNCMKNGRPDSEYLYWRWKPQDCELPQFNSVRFLEAMRNKSWAFIGDSISRNHVQSLLCILSKVEEAIEVYHDEEYRSKRWHFPSHNFTLSVIWSPFLAKAAIFEDMNGVSSSEIQLYLDILDEKWTQQYQSFNYVVISGGKWFLKTAIYWENNTISGCHYCQGKNLTELGFDYAYRKALQLVLGFFISKSDHKDMILFRTSTPDHFENGEWFSGGTCNRTVPFKDGEVSIDVVDKIMRDIELDEFKKAAALGLEKGVSFKLLDTTYLSLLRPDGHPGPYRQFHPFAVDKNAEVQNDCLHWCLPGPIDSWNDLVMEMVLG